MPRDEDFLDYLTGRGQSFNRYSAGNRRYGPTARRAPNIGPTGDVAGYVERDNRARLMRNAALRKLQAFNKNSYASSDAMRPLPKTPYSGRAGGF